MPRVTRKRTKAAPVLLRRLQKHFAAEPATLPVVEQQFGLHERPNLHLALEEMIARPKVRAQLVGVLALEEHDTPSLARLSQVGSAKHFDLGPVRHVDITLPGGRHLSCVKDGLYFVRDGQSPLAVIVTAPRYSHPPVLQVEVMAA